MYERPSHHDIQSIFAAIGLKSTFDIHLEWDELSSEA